jgi:hypothetical protein
MFHDVVEEVENCGRLPPGTCPATTARSISKRRRDARGKRGKILINAFRQLNVFRQSELHADKRGEAVEERRHLKAQ